MVDIVDKRTHVYNRNNLYFFKFTNSIYKLHEFTVKGILYYSWINIYDTTRTYSGVKEYEPHRRNAMFTGVGMRIYFSPNKKDLIEFCIENSKFNIKAYIKRTTKDKIVKNNKENEKHEHRRIILI